MSSSTPRELIKVELTRICRIAEKVNNDCLLYFIDMAISEVETKSHYRNDKREVFTLLRQYLDRQAS